MTYTARLASKEKKTDLILTSLSVGCPVKCVQAVCQLVSRHPLVRISSSLCDNLSYCCSSQKVDLKPLVMVVMSGNPAERLMQSSIWCCVASIVSRGGGDSCIGDSSRFQAQGTVTEWGLNLTKQQQVTKTSTS